MSPAEQAPLVCGSGIAKRFSRGGVEVEAVAAAEFKIGRGEHIALVGASGSGKSTLLHLMAGFLAPSAGSLAWPAIGAEDVSRSHKVAMVFQAPSLVPWLSAVENVEAPLLIQGMAWAEARSQAEAALEAFGLGGLAAKLPEELSGGQAQRVAIARAVAQRAVLLLADEPTGQLDQATGRDVMRALITAAVDTGAALVVATHDPAIAAQMRASWHLEHGHLQARTGEHG